MGVGVGGGGGEWSEEGDFVRFNDKYRLRERREKKKAGEIGLRSC